MAGKTYSGTSHAGEHMLAANKGFSISTLHAEEAAKEVLVPLAFRMRKKYQRITQYFGIFFKEKSAVLSLL